MLNKQHLDTIKLRLSEVWEVIKRLNPITKERISASIVFVRKSWKSIIVILPVFLLLYYTVGSLATHNIDKSLIAMVKTPPKRRQSMDLYLFILVSIFNKNSYI